MTTELLDSITCDQCGQDTSDPTCCPHLREVCPECLEGHDCRACVAERSPR
jgi:hypothetical protein